MENKITIFSSKNISHTFLMDGFIIDGYDFIQINPIIPTDKILTDHFIFTSKNAVKYSFKHYNFKNILSPSFYCVGEKTAETIKKQGFTPLIIAENAEKLAEKLILTPINSFSFFCGKQHLDTLPLILTKNKRTLQKIIVYETFHTPVKIKQDYDGYIFYSPSGVDSFFTLNTIPPQAIIFTIGETTAKHITSKTTNKVVISPSSKIDSVINTIKTYFSHYDKK